jgi:hypothetical protein
VPAGFIAVVLEPSRPRLQCLLLEENGFYSLFETLLRGTSRYAMLRVEMPDASWEVVTSSSSKFPLQLHSICFVSTLYAEGSSLLYGAGCVWLAVPYRERCKPHEFA